MRTLLFLVVLSSSLVAGCGVAEVATGQPRGVETQTPSESLTDGEPEPCELLEAAQRGRLGVGPGRESDQTPLEGAVICNWNAISGPDTFQAGVLPSRYQLDNVSRSYPDPQDLTVSGLRGVSTSQRASVANRSCMIFALLSDGRLAAVSYFRNGGPNGSTHDASCAKATIALEMVVATVQAR
ncbi:DUF3558 family protein [Pseudonocardia sp.]|jgi:hypothetical protein|uniref:DUF3558 family protein n=1 Tax=Pseudonocardia sp. TaxID=60912 RepID=UPI003D0D0BBA